MRFSRGYENILNCFEIKADDFCNYFVAGAIGFFRLWRFFYVKEALIKAAGIISDARKSVTECVVK